MSKAFTKEDDGNNGADDDRDEADLLPKNTKNYMTPGGFAALQAELRKLLHDERPKVVEIVSWAAGNGDRSENGDYLYGKKRLREIDRRVRYLTKRIETAEVVEPKNQTNRAQVFFGATVTYAKEDGKEHTVTLVGIDEADLTQGKISWVAPMAQALLKAKVGDEVRLRTPGGEEMIEVIKIAYPT
jgi:transcription elongation factor GreB